LSPSSFLTLPAISPFHYYHAGGGKAARLSEYWQSANRYTYQARLTKGSGGVDPGEDNHQRRQLK
jgi:hypothetical protein